MGARIPAEEPGSSIRQHPTTPYQDVSRRPLGSISKAYYDEKAGKLYAAFNYPGVVAHVGSIDVATGDLERIVDIKGPVIYTVTSLTYDPDGAADLLHDRQRGTPRPRAGRSAHRQDRAADEGRAHRRSGVQPRRQVDLGDPTSQRHRDAGAHPSPVQAVGRGFIRSPYGTVVYDLDVSPDGTRVSASFGEIDGKQNVRVFSTEKLLAGDVTPEAAVRFRTVGSVRIRLHSRRQVAGRQLVLHRGVEHFSLRHRDRKRFQR